MVKNAKRVIAIAMAAALSIGVLQAGATDASAAAKKIKLSKTKLTLEKGKKATIKLKNVKKKNVKKIKWTTSKKKVATVSPAKKSAKTTVKAVGVGKATVKAKLGKKTYSCKVTVKAKKKTPQNLGMFRDTYATYVGTAVGVRPFTIGTEALDMSRLTYTSSDPSVAKIVGNLGAVEGVSAGTATITIKPDVGDKLTATVKVFASKDDADELNDFYQKQVNDRLAELKKEGIDVNDGSEHIGGAAQKADRNKMVKAFSDKYKGNKYPDNTPEDAIASIRSVFDVEETAKKERLMKDIKEYLEPLEKATTYDDFIDYNKKVVMDGEFGLWKTTVGESPMNTDDPDSGLSLRTGVPLIKPELVPATILTRKSDFQNPETVERLKTLIKETLLLAGETEADADKNKEMLAKVLEEVTPKISLTDVAPQLLKMTPEEQMKYLMENGLEPIAAQVSGGKLNIDDVLPGLKMGEAYKELGVKDNVVISSVQVKNCWTTLMDFLKTGKTEEIRELMKFCVASKYVEFTESGFTAQELFNVKKEGLTIDPTAEEIKKEYDEKAITFLCDKVGFEICGEYTKYLGGETLKADLTKIINLYKEEFTATFKDCSWMSEQGKAGAVKKMDKMEFVIGDSGTCDQFRLREDLDTAEEGGSIFGNCRKISKSELTNFVAILGEKLTGQNLYFFTAASQGMTPMTVNASYANTSNVFCIYAGIIGEETYKPGNDVFNLGRIGYVSGHEIGHAFDADGATFDENGEPKQWMSAEDVQHFKEVQAKCIKLFDQYSAFYDKATKTIYYADGEKELGENMADFSAAEVAVRIGKKTFDSEGMKELFKQFSLFWSTMKYDPGLLVSDNHGPAMLRGAVPFQMQDAFYETFGIKEGDAMYIAPDNRIRLWS